MGLSMLPTQLSPIAVDMGTSSIKVLQVTLGEQPRLHTVEPILRHVHARARPLAVFDIPIPIPIPHPTPGRWVGWVDLTMFL